MPDRSLYRLFFIALFFFDVLCTSQVQAQVIYVDSAHVSGTHNGTSWATAYNDFVAAINAASSGSVLWVAKGTYQPALNNSFSMKSGVAIYGGFTDTATTMASRNWMVNTTILEGNDSSVIKNTGIDNSASLDGFTITKGGGPGLSADPYGGGIRNINSSPIFSNLIISNNQAIFGGGVYNTGGAPVFTNITVSNNRAGADGGGMYNDIGATTLTNMVVSGNYTSGFGGGIFNNGTTCDLTNVVFYKDTAFSGGGGMANYNVYSSSFAVITRLVNVIFSNNVCNKGGGLYDGKTATSYLINVTFSNNSGQAGDAFNEGGGEYSEAGSQISLLSCVFWGNTAALIGPYVGISGDDMYETTNAGMAIYNSYLQTENLLGSHPDTTKIIMGATDPFVNDAVPIGADGLWMTTDDGLELKMGSPAINGGVNDGGIYATDITGGPRIRNGIIDMGAYEANVTRWYVDSANISGTYNGTSWATAYNDFQLGMNAADSSDSIWVAKGTYSPVNNTSFNIKTGEKIYGGFIDTSTVLTSRNWNTNLTILKGNGRRVLYDSSITGTLLDGFTVTNGIDATGFGGAGLHVVDASVSVANCAFNNNTTTAGGGAIFLRDGNVDLSGSVFTGNSAGYGGAVRADVATGGLYANGNVFYKNSCSFGGGGAISFSTGTTVTTDTLLNNVFIANKDNGTPVAGGGGALNLNSGINFVTGNTFYLDSTSGGGGAIRTEGNRGYFYIFNDIFSQSNAVYIPVSSSADIYLSNTGTNNYFAGNNIATGTSPQFVDTTDMPGPDGIWMTVDDGLQLKIGSPAINTGNDLYVPQNDSTDILKHARVLNGDPDIGAYESLPLTVYTFTGSGSWSNAANWSGNTLPPSTLPLYSEISIDETDSTQNCILDTPQIISTGAILTVQAGRKLVIPGDLKLQ